MIELLRPDTIDMIDAKRRVDFAANIKRYQPFRASSASDKTDDWPYWFVADRQGINRSVELFKPLRGSLPFVTKQEAHELAAAANG